MPQVDVGGFDDPTAEFLKHETTDTGEPDKNVIQNLPDDVKSNQGGNNSQGVFLRMFPKTTRAK
jgi:hypothetical protein